MRKLLLSGMLLAGFAMAGHAQSAYDRLADAGRAYEKGQFAETVSMLPRVKHLSPDDRFEAYRLLALSYIGLYEEHSADSAVRLLLQSKPSYKDFPYVDPAELTKLLDGYRVMPRLELGGRIGVNAGWASVTQYYSASSSSATFKPAPGFNAGVYATLHLSRTWSLQLDALYEGIGYRQHTGDVTGWKQEYREAANYFSIPLTAGYDLLRARRLVLTPEAGFQYSILHRSIGNISMADPSGLSSEQVSINRKDNRTAGAAFLLAGCRLFYQLPFGRAGLNIRYAQCVNNTVRADRRYNDPATLLNNRYIDSDLRMQALGFSLCYQLPVRWAVKKISVR